MNLHKQLLTIGSLCRPELIFNPPPSTQVDPLAFLLSRRDPSRRSRNFVLEFENSYPGTEEEMEGIQAAIQDIKAPCDNVPEHRWTYEKAMTGCEEAAIIVEGCTGGGKTSLQDRIGLSLGSLGKTVLFASKTNVAVDELLKRMIKLIDELELPACKDLLLRIGSRTEQQHTDLLYTRKVLLIHG
ncbi:hypothetical protein K491DRAFT_713648 [Lophiostoma macrostomum CBS 122681]|uniref:Uncharacterized protein n=1 Tax=Lophiostoma macrostomum CBS 122681 TaxID=1314788 RepID=A0A6A6TFP6_9PLEO|nr:hypothetical protein K491DRAFT_713648 [Lophiostoma macrostomum CBS 122681]